jgi:hypothetical protein
MTFAGVDSAAGTLSAGVDRKVVGWQPPATWKPPFGLFDAKDAKVRRGRKGKQRHHTVQKDTEQRTASLTVFRFADQVMSIADQ